MSDLHMQDFYNRYYNMADNSDIFSLYCEKVYGIDFSQDGFSDINQTNDLIAKLNISKQTKVLDIGCGNGKLCEYIYDKSKATVYGFDYSPTAIASAIGRIKDKYQKLIFEVGFIGEKTYANELFDAIISIDTLYFANDLQSFLKQVYGWLKPQGTFIAFYSCFGEAIPPDKTVLADTLKANSILYKAIDYTEDFYYFMKRKRSVALDMKDDFYRYHLEEHYKRIITESIDVDMPYHIFKKHFNRYMYLISKEELS